MKNAKQGHDAKQGPQLPSSQGEAAGRQKGYESEGGQPGNDPLEDGQLRGVDADGKVIQGTHEGPDPKSPKKGTDGSKT
jgi:hypothetical protein